MKPLLFHIPDVLPEDCLHCVEEARERERLFTDAVERIPTTAEEHNAFPHGRHGRNLSQKATKRTKLKEAAV